VSTNVRIIHAHDFIKVTPEGRIDLENSKKLLLTVALAAAPLVNHQIIIDTRHVLSDMSTSDLYNLAAELRNFRKDFTQKTAVLCQRNRFDSAGFFALCAKERGFQVKAFYSYEAAIEWLVADAA